MEEKSVELYDRFSFDDYFRKLLNEGFDYEEAIDFINFNCKLSALVIETRIENKYYLKITIENKIADDLRQYRQEIFNARFKCNN